MRVVEYRMERIFGVDFSGATDAGKKVWIACGVNEGTRLCIVECMRGDTLPGSAAGRERCLAALRDLIAAESACAFGLDFPFGLPRVLVAQADWKDFILSFPTMYPDAEAFRQACRSAAEGREHRRLTDRQSRTPFSPYNLRLYRQTYFGLREVLYPLVRDRQAAVLPMQRPCRDKAWVLEICPASTLKREGLYPSYKGPGQQHLAARHRILERMEASGALSIASASLRSKILADPTGDALDSAIAAFATFRTVTDPDRLASGDNIAYRLEGYVYD
jgi:hypothetical protein